MFLLVSVYTKRAGANLSGSGRRKPLEKQVTPAKYHEWYLLRAFTTCLTLQIKISYVSTRSEQIANANLSMSEALSASSMTNVAIFLIILRYRAIFSHVAKITACLRKTSSHLMSFFEKGENF